VIKVAFRQLLQDHLTRWSWRLTVESKLFISYRISTSQMVSQSVQLFL